jgi:uncharacterized protein with gpF-like domain
MVQATASELAALQSLEAELNLFISAAEGEPWPDAITQDDKAFNGLLKTTDKMTLDLKRYFADFAERRAAAWFNWSEYERQARPNRKAAEVVISADAQLVAEEQKILLNVVFGHLLDIEVMAIEAGSRTYHIPLAELDYLGTVQKQARQYAATLVSEVTKTTVNALRASIATSIQLGEDINGAAERVNKIIDNPARAATIAKTESVNAFGNGTLQYGKQTGAKGKVLSVVLDERTSPICRELAGKYQDSSKPTKIDTDYQWSAAGGGAKKAPGFHVRCRTGHYLIY